MGEAAGSASASPFLPQHVNVLVLPWDEPRGESGGVKPEAEPRAPWGWVVVAACCSLPWCRGVQRGQCQDSSAVLFCAAAQAVKCRLLLPIQPCQGPAGIWRNSDVFLFSFQTEKA